MLFGLFNRKPKTGGWIKLRRGEMIPVEAGRKFDLRFENGDMVLGMAMGVRSDHVSENGVPFTYMGGRDSTRTNKNGEFRGWSTAYRPHDPESLSDELVTRAERENQWKDWIRDPHAKPTGPVDPSKHPVKAKGFALYAIARALGVM